jgi:hypothetical protein
MSASFSPDGTRIVTASWDGTVKVWDVGVRERFIAGKLSPEEREYRLLWTRPRPDLHREEYFKALHAEDSFAASFRTSIRGCPPWSMTCTRAAWTKTCWWWLGRGVPSGENTLAFYRATNTSDRPVWGMATFNVFPEQVAPFFNKLQCFCFTEQLLQPGESVEMPVSFFVDPQMTADKDAFWVRHITLSYTFYPATAPKSAAGKVGDPATPEGVQRKGQAG